ncbi:MAG: hypothetical protein Q9159_002089 [Coniocarpon cinnabarinum]
MAGKKNKRATKPSNLWGSLATSPVESHGQALSPTSQTPPELHADPDQPQSQMVSLSDPPTYSFDRFSASAMDELDRPERVKYLSVIDKIRETGVTKDISLPQLVVVGDQSSGKSSLLEGITGLAFPVSSDVCTRFATQIILRRCPPEQASAEVSIIPGPNSVGNGVAKNHLEDFKRTIDPSRFENEALATILSDASKHLGLPSAGVKLEENNGESLEKRFSEDIVRIELSGPNQRHLSVVDVPGLFHNPTKFQTAEDKEIIRNLVQEYIGDKRTIILGVCSAISNLATQEVFQLARQADPNGQRTVGIVTKCDAVASGDEQSVLDIATNKYEPLKHGWFVVKNRSTKDIHENVTVQQRHQRELSFFNTTAPWNTIPKERRGVGPLKDYLGKLLSDHARSEFPELVRELKSRREESLQALQQLGDSRQNSAEQRTFLGDIAAKYERRVQDVLDGTYDRVTRDNPKLKLRKLLRDLEDGFEQKMHLHGHLYPFKTVNDETDKEFERPTESSEEDIYDWIEDIYLDNRGTELPGMVNPSIVRMAFQEQSIHWDDITFEYFQKALDIITAFRSQIFELLISEDDVRQNVVLHLEGHTDTLFDKARQSVSRCLKDERDNILKTLNDYYSETLEKCRTDRIEKRLKGLGLGGNDFFKMPSLNAIVGAAKLKNTDEAIYSIHDALKAYYKVAIKRFVDAISLSVIETDLLGDDGPVKVFNTHFVNNMSDDQLASIAAETSMTSIARAEASAKVERLQQALDLAKGIGA